MDTYTEREVEIFLKGMSLARDIAQSTGKGLTSSRKIQELITTNRLRFERCKEKGVFNETGM